MQGIKKKKLKVKPAMNERSSNKYYKVPKMVWEERSCYIFIREFLFYSTMENKYNKPKPHREFCNPVLQTNPKDRILRLYCFEQKEWTHNKTGASKFFFRMIWDRIILKSMRGKNNSNWQSPVVPIFLSKLCIYLNWNGREKINSTVEDLNEQHHNMTF